MQRSPFKLSGRLHDGSRRKEPPHNNLEAGLKLAQALAIVYERGHRGH
jgi:hypothetical protein